MPPRLAAALLLALALPWPAPVMLRGWGGPDPAVDATVATEDAPPQPPATGDDPRPPPDGRGPFAFLLAALIVAVNLASAPPR